MFVMRLPVLLLALLRAIPHHLATTTAHLGTTMQTVVANNTGSNVALVKGTLDLPKVNVTNIIVVNLRYAAQRFTILNVLTDSRVTQDPLGVCTSNSG